MKLNNEIKICKLARTDGSTQIYKCILDEKWCDKNFMKYCRLYKEENMNKIKKAAVVAGLIFLSLLAGCDVVFAQEYTNNQIADAIYLAEGGAKTSHPYGILAHYVHTSPRQACLNSIAHARRDWAGKGDFISFLGSRYCPVGAANDPRGLNKNWVKNVKYFLEGK